MMTEGREVDPDQITQHVVHPALHQDYASDFWSWRVTDIAPTFTSPILVGIASHMRLPEWSSEETSPSTSPQKKQATKETVDPPSLQVSLPKGMTEKDLLPRRHEVFTSDYEWVQHVRGRLLRLEANDLPSKSQIDCSSHFCL